MKARIEVATDIAMLGAWDSAQDDPLLKTSWGKEFEAALEDDARSGKLFLLRTGGDCGGQVEVLIDEPVSAGLRRKMKQLSGEFLLSLPSGRMVVGGVEDYRVANRKVADQKSALDVTPGHYLLSCYVCPEESASGLPSQTQMSKMVGKEDYAYYQRVSRQGLFGFVTLLVFPVLTPFVGWKISGVLTITALLVYFNLFERVRLKRDKRYIEISGRVNDAHRVARAGDLPQFIFQLRKVDYAPELKGGSLQLE